MQECEKLLNRIVKYDIILSKEGVLMQYDDWVKPFLSLDLCGGKLISILNDDEDMLEIRWADGMWIDVGFIEEENTYYITTVCDDTLEGWNNPLSVLKVTDREDLADVLQQEILRCRR